MARSGFVLPLVSPFLAGRKRTFFAVVLVALMLLVEATLSTAQLVISGAGPQPTEATNGEVSLDNLNVHIAIPIVTKSGIGLTFQPALYYNSNVYSMVNGGLTPSQGYGWGWLGYFPSGGFVRSSIGTWCNDQEYLPYIGYKDAQQNIHSIGVVYLSSTAGTVRGCTPGPNGNDGLIATVTSYNALLTDGSAITVNLVYSGISTVTDADGTVHTMSTGFTMADVHGNTISNVFSGDNWVATDTLNVPELTTGDGCVSGTPDVAMTYPTSTGNAPFTINCSSETIQTAFGCDGGEYRGTGYVPTSIGLPDGSSYLFTYESQVTGTITGRLASITYPSGKVVTYQYTGSNNGIFCEDGSTSGLTRTTPDGVYTYTRSSTGFVTTLVGPSPASNTSVYTFESYSNYLDEPFWPTFLVQEVDYQGSSTLMRTTLVCYNGNQTNCTTATVPANGAITQKDTYITLAGMTASSRVSETFDAYGNITKRAFYDFGAGTPTRQTIAGPYGYTWNGSTTSPNCTTAIGSGVNNKPCQVQLQNGSGTQLRNSYYQYGTTTYTGSLLSSAVLTGGSVYLTTSATYNANGTVATSTDANGNKTSMTYGACNSGMPTLITLPNSLYITIGWDTEGSVQCAGAVPVSTTGVDGNSVSAAYNDPFWRITKFTDQETNSTNTSYGPNPPTVESILNFGTSTVDKFRQVNVNALTAYSQQLEAPSSSNWDTVQSGYVWGSTGETTSTSMPCITTKGTGCTNGVTTTTHDALGRPLVQTDGGGGTITYTYTGSTSCTSSLSGCFVKTTTLGPAPSGEVVKEVAQEYNGLGQLLSSCVISSATGSAACGFGGYTGFPTAYVYNADGTVASVSKSSSTNTQTHSFTYDAIGRTLTATYPESGTTTYQYDGNGCYSTPMKGLLTSRTDANGNYSCYTYDTLNRLVAIGQNVGPNWDGNNKFFVYDSAAVNGITMVNTSGRLAEAYTSPNNGVTKVTDEGFSYTVRGEVSDVYESTPNSGGYYHTNATYFANGALDVLSGITGGPWTYTVDGKGRPYSAVNGSTNLVSSVTYNAANQPCIVTLGLGDTDTYVYDNNSTCTGPLVTGRMTSYTFSVGATPTTDVGSLSWNANGTLRSLAITDGFNAGGTQTCSYGTSSTPGYDEQGRLVSAVCNNSSGTNVWGQSFSYDAFNNLTKSVPSGDTGITWQPGYNQTNNQYTLAGTSYDSNGNLLTDTFHTYTWNQDNHPLTATGGATAVTYDAFGRMVEHLDGSTYKEPLLSPVGNIGLMTETAVSQFRIPLPGGPTYVTGSSFWHKDWLGSVRLVSGRATRTETVDRAFAPYGETYNAFGATTDVNFTGDNQDFVAGTFDTLNRELNPTQGRWISTDPAHSAWNAYSYTTNPLLFTDPTGLIMACCGSTTTNDGDDVDGTDDGSGGEGVGGECLNAGCASSLSARKDMGSIISSILNNYAYDLIGPDGSTVTIYGPTSEFAESTGPIPAIPGIDYSDPPEQTSVQVAPFGNTVLQAGGNYGILNVGGSYVPTSGDIFFSLGPGNPDIGIYAGAGPTTNLDQKGFSLNATAFFGIGAGGSYQPKTGDTTEIFGLGTPGIIGSGQLTWLVASVPPATFSVSLPTIPPGMNATYIGEGMSTYEDWPTH